MWFELGKLPEALEDAQLLAEAEPTAYHQMHLIDLMVNAALTADLRPKLTRLLECADLTVTQGLRALRYAQAIQESRLAQRLLLVAAHNIKNDLEVEYVMQAQLMGNFPTMPAVASRFQTLLAEGKTQLFTLINVEDFLAQTQLQNDGYKVYEQGDVSLHHLHSQEPVEFACAYLEARPHLPLYIRHGGLTVSVREDGPPELQGVTTLAMDLTSLLLAARLKVLDLLSQEFEIAVATDHVRDLTYMLADLPSTSDLRAVLQDLLSWIREQHEQNRLTYKPSPEDRRHDHSAEILGLAALVVPAATASERLCLDDRWAQQMALQNRRLVTDLVSVLDALVKRGRFSETAYFQAVHQLRRAGMRFLPITARELLHWLRAAEVQDGRLRETDDLALLRQYYAGCFGAASPLQPITVQGTNDLHIGEMPFLLRYLHETKQALKDVFKSERSPVALANWMFEHLLIDMVAVGELPWGRHPHGRSVNQLRELELLDLASFDVTMTPQSKEAYYKWINRTLLQPRLTLDPELQDRFVAIWKDHLLNLLGPQTTAIHRAALAHLANGTESYVPVLHDAVASDVQYMKSTGRRRIHLCQINGRSFDMGKIWNAFNTLHGFPGRTTQIKDREGMQWTWSLDDDDGVCLLAVNDEGEGFRIRIQEMWLALDTRKEREAHLPEILQALPGISPTDPRVSAMLRARPLDARLDQLADLKSSIPDFFYSALFSALQEKPLDREWNRSNFLPDDPLVILQFVGLEALVHEPDRPFQDVIEAAACSLLERDGPKTTAARFAGLPIALPEVIRRAFLQDVSTFANLRDDLRHQRKSPFGLAHTVRLLKDYPEQEAARLRKRLAASMLQGTYLQDIIAFHRVLRWTYEQIQFRAPTWPAPAFMAASWVHTHEIYSQLREIGYPPDSIWQIFDHDRTFLPLRALLHHPDELSDICMPSHMTPLRTVMLNTLYAADDLLEELRHLFAEILLAPSVEGSDVRLLKNVLIGTEISLPNHLNSFLGRNIELALRHPDWAVFSLLNSEAPKLIFELQKTTEAKNLMQPVVLHLTGRQKPHPMRHNEDFCASVMEFDIQSWQPEQIMTGLIGAAQLTAQTEGTIEPKLLNDLTLVLNTTAPDRALAMQTFEILVALITHPKYRNQELRHLATLLDQVVTPHDQLRTALFPVVLRFAFECPAETASVFWPVLLRWRELGQTRQLDWWAELGGAEFNQAVLEEST
ncbi:hypothetical protein BXU09_17775 [Deinococcus sp. LM3]|nr:hypothetical protein BXU09_17775 [Deinococcus sp. LM3]